MIVVDEETLGCSLRQQAEIVMTIGRGAVLLSPREHDEIVGPQYLPWFEARGWNFRHATGSPVSYPRHLGLFHRALDPTPSSRPDNDGGARASAVFRSALPTNQVRAFQEETSLVRSLRLIGEPTIIWLDRVHLADAGSASMIRRAMPLLPTLPLLLVAVWQRGITAADALTTELP